MSVSVFRGFVKGALLVPALGLAAHFMRYAGDDLLHDDYSLKNRFECAYCFNVPNEHKFYHSSYYLNDTELSLPKCQTYYMASPYVIYPAMMLLGLRGAYVAARKKKREEFIYKDRLTR